MLSEIASAVKEAAKEINTKAVESIKEGKSKIEPFSDSVRPSSGIELPKLKKGDIDSEIYVFSDSKRPDVRNGIERPQLVRTELSDKDKKAICKEIGCSKDTVDFMKSKEEAEVYIKANLEKGEVNGKECLQRTDIDMNFKDEFGRTNKERMENGMSPLTNNNEKIELHHIGQSPDSPLAELTQQEHRGKGNDIILHDKQKESEINRNAFNIEKECYWKSRAQNL